MKGVCESKSGTFTHADLPSVTVACTSDPICTEVTVVPANDAEVAQVLASCKKRGQGRVGSCSREATLASCSFEDDHGMTTTFFVYEHDKPKGTQELIAGSKVVCDKHGGAFIVSPKK